MERVDLAKLRQLIALGESQRVEFKGDAALDGAYKNHICREIAAMSNGGGGLLLIGVSDDGTLTGLPEADARTLTHSGSLQQLLGERMDPVPEVAVYGVQVDEERAVVVVEIAPPWSGGRPRFMPVILTRDVQDSKGRTRSVAGQIIVRTNDRAEVVTGPRQWEQVMAPILARFRADELRPMLRALLDQDMLSASVARGRTSQFAASFPSLSTRLAALQGRHPQAALYEWRLALDGVQLTRQRQHEVVDRASVPGRGWPVPPYISRLVRAFDEGALGFEFPPPGETVSRNLEVIQEFWMLSASGDLVAAFLSRVDLMGVAGQAPPGPERPIDAVEVCEQIFSVLQFAARAAAEAKVNKLWLSFALDNVLERPISRALDPSSAIVDRLGWTPFGLPTSNRRRIEVEGEFDAKALAAEWREMAVRWTQDILGAFGWPISPDVVRRFSAELFPSGS